MTFSVEFADDVYNFRGIVDPDGATGPSFLFGTVGIEGGLEGNSPGTFKATIKEAADFAKQRTAFQKFEPDPEAPVLLLNGKARWQVEREMERETGKRRVVRATSDQAASQASVYTSLTLDDLKGTLGYR